MLDCKDTEKWIWRCPECESRTASTTLLVIVTGLDRGDFEVSTAGTEIDLYAPAWCEECGHDAHIAEFWKPSSTLLHLN